MRPLRLTMTAFGPYAGTETVDFDALTELGLFVVAGNNGSGKTTIFDALHYALFGTLPGRRATYVRLRSDHAEPSVECSVTLDFAAHGQHWRVQRFPKQTRPKRRGTGVTEADRRATLYKLEQGHLGPAVAMANKIGEVDQQCRDLVGLSGKQFERVALLPQGEFSRVLSESGDRRTLLRALFSSELFGDATTLLTEQATVATAADQSLLDRLEDQRTAVTSELAALIGTSPSDMAATTPPPELLEIAQRFRHNELVDRARQVDQLQQDSHDAANAHQGAVLLAQRIQRHNDVTAELAQHTAGQANNTRDLERLGRARAAVPVASQARALAQQQHRLVETSDQVQHLQSRLDHALTTAGLSACTDLQPGAIAATLAQVADLTAQLGVRRAAAQNVADLDRAVKTLQGDLRRRRNDIAQLAEQMQIAGTQQRQFQHQFNELQAVGDLDECEEQLAACRTQLDQRTELAELDAQHTTIVAELEELALQLDQFAASYEQAEQAHTSQVNHEARAQAAIDELEQSTKRRERAQAFQTAAAKLAQARARHEHARSFATTQWDAYIAGTAVRVAEALVDDEPCPVCGSEDHPAPATAVVGDNVATDLDVAAAREQEELTAREVSGLEAHIEALRDADPQIASNTLADLAAEITTAKAMALGARAAADEARNAATQRVQLAAKIASLQTAKTAQTNSLQQLAEQQNQLRGALGPSAHEAVEIVAARTEAAWQARIAAETARTAGETLQAQLSDATATIDTIGLEQIAAENRLATTTAQLGERQSDLQAATTQLEAVDADIAAASATTAGGVEDYELRTRAARGADSLLRELDTAVALQKDAHEAQRRAKSLLDERLAQSAFESVEQAQAAFVAPDVIAQLEAHTQHYAATVDRLQGQLHELGEVPGSTPNVADLLASAQQAERYFTTGNRMLIETTSQLDRLEADLRTMVQTLVERETADQGTRRLERVAGLVKGDNDRNTSLENWVLAAHLRNVVELANLRLSKSTHQRFQLCVLDTGENRRGTWGLDLGVEDTVTGTRRPTAGLSGGELFQASLALALGLADAVMSQSAGVQIDALFIDEGFGSLDDTSVERAIDLLDELRDRGAMVGVITHVPALRNALPRGITVVPASDGRGSTIQQALAAA